MCAVWGVGPERRHSWWLLETTPSVSSTRLPSPPVRREPRRCVLWAQQRHRLNRAETAKLIGHSGSSRWRAWPNTHRLEPVERRTMQGLSKKEIIRCLKRYIAREIYRALTGPTVCANKFLRR